jgi:hypothetical protein
LTLLTDKIEDNLTEKAARCVFLLFAFASPISSPRRFGCFGFFIFSAFSPFQLGTNRYKSVSM